MYKSSKSSQDFMSDVKKWYNDLSDSSRNAIIGGVLGGVGVGGATYLTSDPSDSSKHRIKETLRNTLLGSVGGAALGGIGTKFMEGISNSAVKSRQKAEERAKKKLHKGSMKPKDMDASKVRVDPSGFSMENAGDVGFAAGALGRAAYKFKKVTSPKNLKRLSSSKLKPVSLKKLTIGGVAEAATIAASGAASEYAAKNIYGAVKGDYNMLDKSRIPNLVVRGFNKLVKEPVKKSVKLVVDQASNTLKDSLNDKNSTTK